MRKKRTKEQPIRKTSIKFSKLMKCNSWMANALLQASGAHVPGIKNMFESPSYRTMGKITGSNVWFLSLLRNSTNGLQQKLEPNSIERCILSIQYALCTIITEPLEKSTEFFRAFVDALNDPFLDKNGEPTKLPPNGKLYFFLVKNHKTVESLKSIKKIHKWLVEENGFKIEESNFRRLCSRIGLRFRKA